MSKEGLGFIIAMKTFDMSRPGVAAQALGIAAGALDEAVKYSRERRQFGKPICSFQGIQFMLADMATQVEAARALVYQAARYIDSGAKNISKISAMCKLHASDTAMQVTTDAVQIFGGYGYMKEYPVEKSTAALVLKNSANSRSSSTWPAKVPLAMREPVVPVPLSSIARCAAAIASGSKLSPR